MSKRIAAASLSGDSTDPYAAARKINSASRDAAPVLPIGNGYGEPSIGADGRARLSESDSVPPPEPAGGSGGLSSGESQESHPADRSGMQGTMAAHGSYAPAQRKLSPDELMAMARQMQGNLAEQHAALMGAGASTGVRDSAGGKVPDWLAKEMKDEPDM